MTRIGEDFEVSVERGVGELLRLGHGHELVALADADEERPAERRGDTAEIEPVSHSLLRDGEMLEVGIVVRPVRSISCAEVMRIDGALTGWSDAPELEGSVRVDRS